MSHYDNLLKRLQNADSFESARIAQEILENVPESFQNRVAPWVVECFGPEVAKDVPERSHRFIEEALELAQSSGISKRECAELLDYVYNRPTGDKNQEVGGTMITLAALCTALGIEMAQEGERELTRIKGKTAAIRAKWLSKPKFGPLPGEYPTIPLGKTEINFATGDIIGNEKV
jgi:hypothetical protein